MVTSNISAIDQKIISMRKDNCRLNTIFRYLVSWDGFAILDEQIVLCHIIRVLDENNMAVSRKEVLRQFNKYYDEKHHLDKRGYLNWIYADFHIKQGTKVNTSQIRVPAKNGEKQASFSSEMPRTAPFEKGSDISQSTADKELSSCPAESLEVRE